MGDKAQVVKHLEMLQGVISRLGHDSFLLKGWSMTILSAAIIFVARAKLHDGWLMLAFIVPVLGFWALDGYFLWQERLFRGIYDDVRQQGATDFAMDTRKQRGKPGKGLLRASLCGTVPVFYGMEVIFVATVFCVLKFC